MKTERELIQQLKGRAEFCLDRGEVKTPELLERAVKALEQREGYKLVPVEPTYEMWSELSRHLGRYMQSHDRYCPKTLKKYFDRFIGEPPEWLSKEVSSWDSDHAFATADLPVFIYKAMIEAA